MNNKEFESKVFGDENEKFVGTNRNENKYKAITKLQELARELKDRENWLFKVECSFEDTGKYHKTSAVYLDFTLPIMIEKANGIKDIISQMTIIADEVIMSVTEDGKKLTMTFSVLDLWE